MPPPPDMAYWLGVKYSILGKQAEGEYQRNIAEAKTLPGLRSAQSFHLRAGGQEALERAATEAADRYLPPGMRGLIHDRLPQFQAPGAGAPGAVPVPGAGAPTPAVPAPETPRAPITFQQLPPQPDYTPPPPRATSVDTTPPSSAVPAPLTTVTPQLMSPEQLTEGARAAAARRQQQPTVLPSLLRPGSIRTLPTVSSFRRGTANVRPRGYAAGDEDILGYRPILGTVPGGGGTVPGRSVGAIGGTLGPGNLPPGGPAPIPSPSPMPSPYSPAPSSTPTESAGTWPGGAPRGFNYDPNAGFNLENLGGVMDATTRMVNPERFNQAVEGFPTSTNIEDRRGGEPPTSRLGGIASNIGGNIAAGGQALASDIWKSIIGDSAAPGGLAGQAGYNDIGRISSGIGALPTTAAPVTEAAPFSGGGGGGDLTEESGFYRKGTANVKAKNGKNGKNNKAGKSNGPPKGLEALLAAMQGGGAGRPPPTQGLKKGSANVKSKGSKSSKSDAVPAGGLEALLSMLPGGGAVGPQAADARPMPMAPGAAAPPGFQAGSADIASSGRTGNPDVDRASQNFDRWLQTVGITPPRATDTRAFNEDFARHGLGMSEAEIARRKAAPGFARGMSNVRGYQEGTDNIPPTVRTPMPQTDMEWKRYYESQQPQGTWEQRARAEFERSQAIGAQETATRFAQPGYAPSPYVVRPEEYATPQGWKPGMPIPSTGQIMQGISPTGTPIAGGATHVGGAIGGGDTHIYMPGSAVQAGGGACAAPGMARGAANVRPLLERSTAQSASNYPFGAGYLFGANEVPGQGSGKTDTVPAMLAPHEAVLNRAAADMLGRGLIAALNERGVRAMSMHRGTTFGAS